MSRVSRAWTVEDHDELSLLLDTWHRLPWPTARMRWNRLMGKRRRAMRVLHGPRKAFRRKL